MGPIGKGVDGVASVGSEGWAGPPTWNMIRVVDGSEVAPTNHK
jgi:hypothetical protein